MIEDKEGEGLKKQLFIQGCLKIGTQEKKEGYQCCKKTCL